MRNDELDGLIMMARGIAMTDADREAQRRSFGYGNARIANESITWEIIDDALVVVEAEQRGRARVAARRLDS